MLDSQPDGSITWRCILCGARLSDFWPPVGTAETKCWRCNAMNYISLMPPGGFTGYEDVLWVAKRWLQSTVWQGTTGGTRDGAG